MYWITLGIYDIFLFLFFYCTHGLDLMLYYLGHSFVQS